METKNHRIISTIHEFSNKQEDLLKQLQKIRVIQEGNFNLSSEGNFNLSSEGNFNLSSGIKSDLYFECVYLRAHDNLLAKVAECLAYILNNPEPVTIVSIGTGAFTIGHEVALKTGNKSTFCYKDGSRFIFNNEIKSQNVVIFEDVITTGSTVRKVIDSVSKEQANVLGVLSLFDRSNKEISFKYTSLFKVTKKGE